MRVLVAEDSRSLAEVLVEGLRDQGMAIDAAHDGLEAAEKIGVNAYDVVVLDRDLPGLHGDLLCQMITGSDQRAMVLMLTAADAPGDRVTGLALGTDDYLRQAIPLSRASAAHQGAGQKETVGTGSGAARRRGRA